MRLRVAIISLITCLLSIVSLSAQPSTGSQLKTGDKGISGRHVEATVKDFSRNNDSLSLSLLFKFAGKKLKRRDGVVVIPFLKSEYGFQRFRPMILNGEIRQKLYIRMKHFGEDIYNNDYDNPFIVAVNDYHRKNGIPYMSTVPDATWLYDADLYIQEVGCADCIGSKQISEEKVLLPKPVTKLRDTIEYTPSFVTPQEVVKKVGRETRSAYIKFPFNNAEINFDYMDNRVEMYKVDSLIERMITDSDIKVSKIAICGFASVDGTYEANMLVSEERTKAYQQYLRDKHNLPFSIFEVSWVGEDWQGLRLLVNEGQVPHRKEVLEIIDNVGVFEGRERELASLADGIPYRYMTERYFPLLRRIDYTIEFEIKKYDVNEAPDVLNKKSSYLVLSEIFALANQSEKTSSKFKEMIDLSLKLYPDHIESNINAAAYYILNGNFGQAEKHLLKSGESAAALNNKAIIFLNKGNELKGKEYLLRAKGGGSKEASENLEKLEKANR